MFYVNKKMAFGIIFVLLVVLTFVVQKLPRDIYPANKLSIAKGVQKNTESLHSIGSCMKPPTAINYTICKTLPVLPVICGDGAKKRDFDETGKKYKVPNIVYLVMVGNPTITFDSVMYLTLRSVARIQQPEAIVIYYSPAEPTGEFAKRANQEIPCLRWVKVEDPKVVKGVEPIADSRTEIIRFQKLIKHGGIYVDNDVIQLKSFDPLRHYSFVAGREHAVSINDGILLAEPKSHFLDKFFHESYLKAYENYDPVNYFKYGQDGLFQFYRKNMASDVHIEDFAINRPLPFEGYEGAGAAVDSHYDISKNYVLHIHPRAAVNPKPQLKYIYTDTEEQVRTRDNIYGAAARIAYFGSPDLIFKPGEKVYNQTPTIKLKPLPKIEPDTSK